MNKFITASATSGNGLVSPQKIVKKMEKLCRKLLQKCALIQKNCAKIVPMFYSASYIKIDYNE